MLLWEDSTNLVLFDFWIKGCGPCMASFPLQQRLQKRYGADGFQLLSINALDQGQIFDLRLK